MGNDLARRVRDGNGGGEVAATTESAPPPKLADQIRRMESEFQLAMPKGLEAVQLVRDAMTCLQNTPKLRECEKFSVLGGLMTCAQLGLRPGVAALGHAWLLPFWDKNYEWVNEDGKTRKGALRAQLILGYQGYRELAFRSGQVSNVVGRIVYEHDHFDVDYGVNDTIVHKPFRGGDRGDPTDYYAIVKYRNGGHSFWHMARNEVERHRDRYAMARTKEGKIIGPWRDNFDEMAVKTCFRLLAKWMPKSPELAFAIAADESVRIDTAPAALDSVSHPALEPADGGTEPDEAAKPGDGEPSGSAPPEQTPSRESGEPTDADWEALEAARAAEAAGTEQNGQQS